MSEKGFFFDPNEVCQRKIMNVVSLEDDTCKLCGLHKTCKSPKMKPFGKNKKRIMIIGESPGDKEDIKGIPFVGKSGILLKNALEKLDIDIDIDCSRTNVLQCRPEDNKFDELKVEFCYYRLEMQVDEFKPTLILCFGQKAARRIIETDIVPGLNSEAFTLIQGDVYFIRKYNCWVSVNYHPAYILRNPDLEDVWTDGIDKALNYLGIPFPKSLLTTGKNILLENKKDILDIFEKLKQSNKPISFDYETKGLNPFREGFKLLMISTSIDLEIGYVIDFIKNPEALDSVVNFLQSNSPKNCHKFDATISHALFGEAINNWTYDIMLSQHVLDERPNKKSLAFMAFDETGEEYKETVDRTDFKESMKTNYNNAVKYSSLDSRFPVAIQKRHSELLEAEGLTEGFNFLMAGNRVLTEMEVNGILIDLEEFERFSKEVDIRNDDVSIILKENKFVVEYYDKYKVYPNYKSSDDMKKLFFDMLGCQPLTFTEKGNPQINDDFYKSFGYSEDTDLKELAESIGIFKSLEKLTNTYLESIRKYTDEKGFLHPIYNLWTARTLRSSCDSPNLQNMPKRDDYLRNFRKIFIASYDYLLEWDYKGAEVTIQAILAQDKVLLEQLNDNYDIHRLWASKLYQKPENKVSKIERYNAKNKFVFPEIYGSYYVNQAKNLELPESHVKKVEEEFKRTYSGIAKWQKKQEEFYNKNGYVVIPTGFKRRAPLSYNQIVNTPIQAVSFHCLLDSLIKIIPALKKRKMKSVPVLQVHDSADFDTKQNEVDELVDLGNKITSDKSQWKWYKGTKLKVEWSIGKNLLEMEDLK
jgi:uracil-DNA glycosylase family 4